MTDIHAKQPLQSRVLVEAREWTHRHVEVQASMIVEAFVWMIEEAHSWMFLMKVTTCTEAHARIFPLKLWVCTESQQRTIPR